MNSKSDKIFRHPVLYKKVCANCGDIFSAKSPKVKYCQNCYEDRKCSNPDCINIVKNILKTDTNEYFCSKKCSAIIRSAHVKKSGKCRRCNKSSEILTSAGICSDCQSKISSEAANSMASDGICTSCGQHVEKRDGAGMCKDCKGKVSIKNCIINSKSGKCKKCDTFSNKRNSVGLCPTCISINIKKIVGSGVCFICGTKNDKRDINGRGKVCSCSQKWYSNQGTNRLNIMIDKLMVRFEDSLTSNYKILDIDQIHALNEISGVWTLWGKNITTGENSCLTVGQTQNLSRELKWTLRVLANENLKQQEEDDPGCTGRWASIQSCYNNFEYMVMVKNISSKEERELIEATYAIKNNALFWLPSSTFSIKAHLKGGVNVE